MHFEKGIANKMNSIHCCSTDRYCVIDISFLLTFIFFSLLVYFTFASDYLH